MKISRTIRVPEAFAGKRLDQAAAALWPEFSRSRIQTWIKAGALTVDGAAVAPKAAVTVDAELVLEAKLTDEVPPKPEPIPLEILHTDPAFFVIDKPPGLVVHPGAGNAGGTLQNALLSLDPGLAKVPRAGIVHRLDKDTSGLLVVARTLAAHRVLVDQLQRRTVSRTYMAVCNGVLTGGGTVDAPIGRHPTDRLRMAVRDSGKPARTHYKLVQRFRAHSLVEVVLETGRTHQIRVHLAHRGYGLVGDSTYGGRPRLPKQPAEGLVKALQSFRRQALHAMALAFEHPDASGSVSFTAPIPADLEALIDQLEQDARSASND